MYKRNFKKYSFLLIGCLLCDLGFPETSELLIQHGADINYVGRDGYTPLLRAVTVANRSTNFIRYLLEHGANINAKNNNGDSALILAASQSKNQFCGWE